VVRVGTSGQYGSGSFISENGLLLTNNHILGAPPRPGHTPRSAPRTRRGGRAGSRQ
jgi:hypothetical protein